MAAHLAYLLLLHWPAYAIEAGTLGEVWQAMEGAVHEGKAGAIGVCNFTVAALLAAALLAGALFGTGIGGRRRGAGFAPSRGTSAPRPPRRSPAPSPPLPPPSLPATTPFFLLFLATAAFSPPRRGRGASNYR